MTYVDLSKFEDVIAHNELIVANAMCLCTQSAHPFIVNMGCCPRGLKANCHTCSFSVTCKDDFALSLIVVFKIDTAAKLNCVLPLCDFFLKPERGGCECSHHSCNSSSVHVSMQMFPTMMKDYFFGCWCPPNTPFPLVGFFACLYVEYKCNAM